MTGPMSAEQARTLMDVKATNYGIGRSIVIHGKGAEWHASVEGDILGPFLTEAEAVARAEDHLLVKDAVPKTKAADPWAHRSEGMRCRTCMWWVPKGEPSTKQLGRCRRHAPTMSGFPAAYEDDWCGDHKLNDSIR